MPAFDFPWPVYNEATHKNEFKHVARIGLPLRASLFVKRHESGLYYTLTINIWWAWLAKFMGRSA